MVCQRREPVSANTIVFHVCLLLSDGQNLAQMLCGQGFAQTELPLPPQASPAAASGSVVSDGGDALVAAAANMSSFGILSSVSPLPSESCVRLSSKRLVCVAIIILLYYVHKLDVQRRDSTFAPTPQTYTTAAFMEGRVRKGANLLWLRCQVTAESASQL